MYINLLMFWRNALPTSSAYETGRGLRRNNLRCSMFLQNIVIRPQKTLIFWIKEVQFQGGARILSDSTVKS